MSAETLYTEPDIESFELDDLEGFDIAGAVMGAMHDTLSDDVMALNEKVVRFEQQLEQATSVFALGFRELQEMAAIAEMYCAHDHDLADAMGGNETISAFRSAFTNDDGDEGEQSNFHYKKRNKNKDIKSKKKTKLSLFEVMLHAREYRQKLFKTK